MSEYVAGTVGPWYGRRLWVRTREVEPIHYKDGTVGARHELYTPLWAKPLDFIHGLIFGRVKLGLES
jgi:hypothetical protein